MFYCPNCKVNIAGRRKRCPLCQGSIQGEGDTVEVYPLIPTVFKEHKPYFRVLLFISVIAAIVCLGINAMIPSSGLWSLIVVAAIACVWLSSAIAINKRRNIIKNLMWQVVTVTGLCVLWDLVTGWRGWSIDFVLPILSVCALACILIILRVLKRYIADYMIYLISAAVLGILPLILWAVGLVQVAYPSLICVGLSLIGFSAIAIFQSENLWAELKRRFHL